MTAESHFLMSDTNFSEERKRMSENTPEVNVEADQAVINTAPDGGGVDNNEAPAESTESE